MGTGDEGNPACHGQASHPSRLVLRMPERIRRRANARNVSFRIPVDKTKLIHDRPHKVAFPFSPLS